MNKILPEKNYQQFIMNKLAEKGYLIRKYTDYDRAFAMDRELFFRFLHNTQPNEMAALRKQYQEKTEDIIIQQFNATVAKQPGNLLHTLKHGLSISSRHLELMYTKPATTFNQHLWQQYEKNLFSVMEEVQADKTQRIDLVIFLNGIAIMSFELKSNAAGQSYEDAVYQYQHDRDPKNRLFLFNAGCLVHFAMDLEQVYMTTKLAGESTRFLPFNKGRGQGKNSGAGNEINPQTGLGVEYMWDDILQKDTVLELLSKFLFIDAKGALIFPRYHQLDCIRKSIADVKKNGTAHNYLIQHSAGSGKTNTITWLAYRLASLHDEQNRQIFDTILIVTDRVIVDRQLQKAVQSIEHQDGLVRVMDDDCSSADLAEALQGHTKIIGTTIQKFPYIVDAVTHLKDKHFAVLIDEAHSSTAGKDMAAVTQSLASGDDVEEDVQDQIQNELNQHDTAKNVSFFAFTATPKGKTLQLFGTPNAQGQKEAFHLYSMKQAIEEGFILDVLANYVTYQTFYTLNKVVADDPEYKTREAKRKIHRFAMLQDSNITQRIQIIVEHFRTTVMSELGGNAKGMVITGSRSEAVKYKQAFDAYVQQKGYADMNALVAFSGKMEIHGVEYTESGMNGFSEKRTADRFNTKEYQLLFVANKYQTGFDQPKLCAMYVMKKLAGVNAVQTLSRLNRTYPSCDKKTVILDFANSYEEIQHAFAPYYEATLLIHDMTPNMLYHILQAIEAYAVIDSDDVENFYFLSCKRQNAVPDKRLYYLEKAKQKILELDTPSQKEVITQCKKFCRVYEFLQLVGCIEEESMYKTYRFIYSLIPLLTSKHAVSRLDLQGKITVTHILNEQTGQYNHKKMTAKPSIAISGTKTRNGPKEKKAKLSQIIDEINHTMGKQYDRDKTIQSVLQIQDMLRQSNTLKTAAQHNTESDFEKTFYRDMDELLIRHVEQNEDFFGLLLGNEEIKKQVLGIFVNEMYREFHGE